MSAKQHRPGLGIFAAALAFALAVAAWPAQAGYKEGKEAFDKRDFDAAWKELEPLAKQGNPDAMFLVGTMHHMGAGAPVSYKDAADWYRKAADAGKLDAVFTMGIVYEGGIGQPRNIAEAFKWYKKSADRGFYAGIIKVANMYGKGQGTAKDNLQSYLWFAIAELRAPKDSNDRFELPIVKDKLGTLLTKEQVADADRKAKAWKPAAR
jgi:TPR repeat protein